MRAQCPEVWALARGASYVRTSLPSFCRGLGGKSLLVSALGVAVCSQQMHDFVSQALTSGPVCPSLFLLIENAGDVPAGGGAASGGLCLGLCLIFPPPLAVSSCPFLLHLFHLLFTHVNALISLLEKGVSPFQANQPQIKHSSWMFPEAELRPRSLGFLSLVGGAEKARGWDPTRCPFARAGS